MTIYANFPTHEEVKWSIRFMKDKSGMMGKSIVAYSIGEVIVVGFMVQTSLSIETMALLSFVKAAM